MLCAVICLNPSVALADETVEETEAVELQEGDVIGTVTLEGSSVEYDLSALAELGEYDYVGSTSIHTQTSYAHIIFSNYSGTALHATSAYASFELPVPVLYRMSVERGHTYSGQIYFMLHVEMPKFDTNGGIDYYRQVSLGDFEQVSNYDGVSVSYYGFTNFPDKSSSGSCDVTVCVTFDNYQPTFTGTLNVNSFFHLYGYFQLYEELLAGTVYFPHPVMTCTVSTDWAGELYDYPTDAIVDSDGSLIKNQTIQQQQIAQQQQQQSQQQHEEMTEKVEESTNIIDRGLDRLGNTILDGIKSFFIPSSEYFDALFEDLKLWFEERLGLLSAPMVFLLDILGMFTGTVPMGEITLPAIGYGDIWISEPYTFRMSDYPIIEDLQGYCHLATNIMMTLWVIELFQKKEKEVLHS